MLKGDAVAKGAEKNRREGVIRGIGTKTVKKV